MKSLYFFGTNLNGLEFVTYVLVPLSILLVILLYLAVNWKVIMIYFFSECCVYDDIDESLKNQHELLQNTLNCYTDKEEKIDI